MRLPFRIAKATDVGFLASRAKPGDVILFKAGSKSSDLAIRRYQQAFSPPHLRDACEYVHAAIYVGKDVIVHAVPISTTSSTSGVQADDLRIYGLNTTVCLLRCPGLTSAMRTDIANQARLRIGASYDYSTIATVVWDAIVDQLGLSRNQGPRWDQYARDSSKYRQMYCSMFVLCVYVDTLTGPANPLGHGPTPTDIFTPADIFMSPGMNSISIP